VSLPSSIPSPLAQPNQVSYGVEVLALFQSYTRDSYRAAFGVDAAPWDRSRFRKAWFDSTVDVSDPSRLVSYQFVGQDVQGNWALQTMQMPAADAASANLPGAIVYPAYIVAPTGATRGITRVSPVELSLEMDARELLVELKGASILDEGSLGGFPVSYPANEARRMWVIVYGNGHQRNVGELLQARNANGVGFPGHWDMAAGDPMWTADPAPENGLHDSRPVRPVPVRALYPNEVLRPVMTGIGPVGVQVVRTDLEQQAALQSGAFLQQDRQMLQEILRIVSGK